MSSSDDVAVVISNSFGLWVAWKRDVDGILALPSNAFRALHIAWGTPVQPIYRQRPVRAKLIIVSKPICFPSAIYETPIIKGASFVTADGFGLVIDLLKDDDTPLSEEEFAIVDSETTISVRHSPDDTATCYVTDLIDIHPDLLEIDGQFLELSKDNSADSNRHSLLTFASSNCNVLVTGPKSVGKSYYLRQLSRISRLSYIFVSGNDLKRPFDLRRYAQAGSPPYIAVLDDIDQVHISDLAKCFNTVATNSQILAVVVAAVSPQIIPGSIRKQFSRNVDIPGPTQIQRQRILRKLLLDVPGDPKLAAHVASLTPGLSACSLKNLCMRALSFAAARNESVNQSHFQDLVGNGTACLQRFAGYSSVVRRLNAIKCQWMQHDIHPNGVLFAGVLLYGPSGCGKTLLVQNVVQQDHSLNCITLSAASIYSKYLGDSEARLRKVFREARQRKPCLLFLDDIDGISGSRECDNGSDLGVKNRVLSTLLNELDGVSGRDGVYIIAATNRIDRIDSALLRPGRFDVHLNIGLPSYSDRLDILKCCMGSMKVDDDVNLEAIAAVEMTGADIRDICQRAGLIALGRSRYSSSVTSDDFYLAFCEWKSSHSVESSSNTSYTSV